MLSNIEMQLAAAQIRAIGSAMNHAIRELELSSTWSGADADRFQLDWNDLVHQRLRAAANKLDGVSFEELKEVLGG